MKKFTLKIKLFLLLISITANTVALAQWINPTGQQWNVYVKPTSTTIPKCTMIYYSDNQTGTFGGNLYKMLYSKSDIIDDHPIGLYREDNGKIFMREVKNMTPTEEYLLYDWTLNIGETAYVQLGESETGLVLDAITDTIINEEERRVFLLHYETNPELTEIWIEGMGSELGFPFSGTKNNPIAFNYFPMTTEMLCYYENGELSWDNPDYDECVMGFVLDVSEQDDISGISVYPNPTKGNVTITGENLSKIEVVNIVRQNIMSSDCEGSSATINMSVLPAGVYIMRIRTENGHELNERIVKE